VSLVVPALCQGEGRLVPPGIRVLANPADHCICAQLGPVPPARRSRVVSLVVPALCQDEGRLDRLGTRDFASPADASRYPPLWPAPPARRSREVSLVVLALCQGEGRLDRLGTRVFASSADASRYPPRGPAPPARRSREASPVVLVLNWCWPRPNLLHSSLALGPLCQFSREIGSAPTRGGLPKRLDLHPHHSVWQEPSGILLKAATATRGCVTQSL